MWVARCPHLRGQQAGFKSNNKILKEIPMVLQVKYIVKYCKNCVKLNKQTEIYFVFHIQYMHNFRMYITRTVLFNKVDSS